MEGQHLEKVENALDIANTWLVQLLAILLVTGMGYVRQYYSARPGRAGSERLVGA